MSARFSALANLQLGAVLGERLAYRWNDKEGHDTGLCNLPILNNGTYALSVSPASAPAKAKRVFTSPAIFAPGEFVTMWYNTLAGRAIELEVKGVQLIDAASTDSEGKRRRVRHRRCEWCHSHRVPGRWPRPWHLFDGRPWQPQADDRRWTIDDKGSSNGAA